MGEHISKNKNRLSGRGLVLKDNLTYGTGLCVSVSGREKGVSSSSSSLRLSFVSKVGVVLYEKSLYLYSPKMHWVIFLDRVAYSSYKSKGKSFFLRERYEGFNWSSLEKLCG